MSENEQSGYDQIQFNSKKYKTISFLSDLGTEDESVAACKAVMRQQCESVTIVDITHEVPPFDVRFAALVLTRAIQFLNEGVVVACVDPGAPKDQRYIAVELDAGVLIGPDNGILAPAVRVIGQPPKRVHQISNEEYRYDTPSATFAARDILAPAAGLIANGMDIAELGPQVPLSDLVPVLLEAATFDKGGAINAEVWSIDRYGNIEINITPEDLEVVNAKFGDNIVLRINNEDYVAKYVETFADLGASELGVLTDSSGLLTIVKNLDDACKQLGLKAGKSLVLLAPNTEVTGELDENIQYPVEEEQPPQENPNSGAMLNQQFPVPQAPPVPFTNPEVAQPQVMPENMNQQNVQPNEFVDLPAQVQAPLPNEFVDQAPQVQVPQTNEFVSQPEVAPNEVPQVTPQAFGGPAQAPAEQPMVYPQDDLQPYVPQEQMQEPQVAMDQSYPEPVAPTYESPVQSDPYSGVITPVDQPQPYVDPQFQNQQNMQMGTVPPMPQVEPDQAQAQQPAALPENMFDLFKEEGEEDTSNNS